MEIQPKGKIPRAQPPKSHTEFEQNSDTSQQQNVGGWSVTNNWLYNKLFNPYKIREFEVPVEGGRVVVRQRVSKLTVQWAFQSRLFRKGGPFSCYVL